MSEELRKYQNRIWELSKQVERYQIALELIASAKPHPKSEAQIAREALADGGEVAE